MIDLEACARESQTEKSIALEDLSDDSESRQEDLNVSFRPLMLLDDQPKKIFQNAKES